MMTKHPYVYRCRVIPLVNKHWRDVHQDFPPVRKNFTITGLPVESSHVIWFLKIAKNVSALVVTDEFNSHLPAGFLPQLLTAAAISAPRLTNLSLPLRDGPVLHSLSMLRQLTHLSLNECWLSGSNNMELLVGLSSLKVNLIPDPPPLHSPHSSSPPPEIHIICLGGVLVI
jgi:hypothetical protein